MYLTKIRLVLLGRSAGGIATLFTHFWFTHRILDSRLLSGFIVSHRCSYLCLGLSLYISSIPQ